MITLENVGSYWLTKGNNTDMGLDMTTGTPDINGDNSNILFYPNPAKSFVQLAGGEKATVVICDLSGTVVYQSVEPVDGFAVGNLPNGIYAVKLRQSDKESIQKLIEKK